MKYFIVNYKTYPQGSGDGAVQLTQKLMSVALPADLKLVVCPQAADIYRVRERFPDAEIWAQHVDLIEAGRATGWTSIETLLMAGISGTIINHSEHELSYEEAVGTVQLAKEHKITSCLAVGDAQMADKLLETKSEVLAFEPPELVGSGQSLMSTDPAEAEEFLHRFKDSESTICIGAGVSDSQDVKKAADIGYEGILIASAIVKADDPALALSKMVEVLK